MEMGNRFSPLFSVVDDQPKSPLGGPDAESFGDLSGGEQEMPESLPIVVLRLANSGDHPLRHDEDVDGSLTIDVAESDADIVLVDDVCGNLASDDFFEERHDGMTAGQITA